MSYYYYLTNVNWCDDYEDIPLYDTIYARDLDICGSNPNWSPLFNFDFGNGLKTTAVINNFSNCSVSFSVFAKFSINCYVNNFVQYSNLNEYSLSTGTISKDKSNFDTLLSGIKYSAFASLKFISISEDLQPQQTDRHDGNSRRGCGG